jgi:predicted membrane protein
MYFISSILILLGVFAMRWNVVIGGQLFSKSLRGFTSYKMELAGQEGWVVSLALLLLPFFILAVLLKYFLPIKHVFQSHKELEETATAI